MKCKCGSEDVIIQYMDWFSKRVNEDGTLDAEWDSDDNANIVYQLLCLNCGSENDETGLRYNRIEDIIERI